MNFYAGIGAVETPGSVQDDMEGLAVVLASAGWCLRSGGAEGADTAFERGCDSVKGKKEIFLPWEDYNQNLSGLCHPTKRAALIAKDTVSWWDACTDGVKKMHARNAHIILGLKCDQPVLFVVGWTERGVPTGGTGVSMSIAYNRGIPVFNLSNPNAMKWIEKWLLEKGYEV